MGNVKSNIEQLKKVFSNNIGYIRVTKLGETQEEFSCRFDNKGDTELTNARTVRKWESGKSLPRIDKLINLSSSIGVTIESLFSDDLTLDALVNTIYFYFN